MSHEPCTMPDHGRPDALHACCRPTRPAPAAMPYQTGFWRDLPIWRRAAGNTAHCLLGCAIGDVAAMTLLPLWWPAIPTALLMSLAVLSGLASSLALETTVLRLREGFPWWRALATAWGMSIISMVGMEVAMNLVDWLAMGGQRLHVHDPRFWLAWIPGLVAGFLAPLPYNYAMLKRHGRSCH